LGSFSKTISPGLRVGFMVAHPDIILAARQARAAMYRHAPLFLQEVIALFIRKGYFEAHLRNLEKSSKIRWSLTHQSIKKHLGFLKISSTQGGTSFWLEGPQSLNTTKLKARLRARSVLIDSGDNYYLARDHKSGFRLGFAFVPIDKIEDGIQIISEEVNSLLH
jgi:GntR family transcriptional regulator/MocR family aminotransferase